VELAIWLLVVLAIELHLDLENYVGNASVDIAFFNLTLLVSFFVPNSLIFT